MAAATTLAAPETPYYARRDDQGFYTWEGVSYRSVTTILAYAPGQHLMSWYGKMAAMRAAAHLYQAGFPLPDADEKLADYCLGLTPRSIDKQAAIEEIYAWARNMREAERYRDHKARIGSIVHHAVYEHALGVRVDPGDLLDYLRHQAISLRVFARSSEPDFEPTSDMIDEVAGSAEAYVLSAYEWIEKAQPEWESIGQEAMVVRQDNGDGIAYAGTVDATITLDRASYEQHFEWPWPENSQKKLTIDFKTSNSLAKSVQAQVEAYASADFIGLVETGETFAVPDAGGIGALHIGPHPSMASVQDEFGTLESKAKVIGAKLYTWPRNPATLEAFHGLCRWANWMDDTPRSEQAKERKPAAPKREPGAPRPCPF